MSHRQMKQRGRYEPLQDVHPRTGGTIEVFYVDHALAASFGLRGAGWAWWSCTRGLTPDAPPRGPHPSAYRAYREAVTS